MLDIQSEDWEDGVVRRLHGTELLELRVQVSNRPFDGFAGSGLFQAVGKFDVYISTM